MACKSRAEARMPSKHNGNELELVKRMRTTKRNGDLGAAGLISVVFACENNHTNLVPFALCMNSLYIIRVCLVSCDPQHSNGKEADTDTGHIV